MHFKTQLAHERTPLVLLLSLAALSPLIKSVFGAGTIFWLPLVVIGPMPLLLWLVRGLSSWSVRLTVTLLYAAVFLRAYGYSMDRMHVGLLADVGLGIAAILLLWHTLSLLREEKWSKYGALAWFLLALLCGLMVAYFSGNKGGADSTVALLKRFFAMNTTEAVIWAIRIRKTLHFVFYGLIAFFAGQSALTANSKRWQAFVFGLGITVIHGSFDEIRQHSVANRTGNSKDVFIDCAGALFFTSPFWIGALIDLVKKPRSQVLPDAKQPRR